MEVMLLLVVVYFLPAIVAGMRSHHSAGAIFVLNLLLGWTLLGWVVALVWAFTRPTPSHTVLLQSRDIEPSVADEIRKLADLKSEGYITDDDFNKRKAELFRKGR